MTEDNDQRGGPTRGSTRLWRKGTLIGLHSQSQHSRTLDLKVPGWPGHRPGQHIDVRLTAPDGYSAQRSYSLAAPVDGNSVSITVDLVPSGEVSPYLYAVMEICDELDIRGPIGGWFVWEPGEPEIGDGPVMLIAGGSGVVPLVTMLRAWRQTGDQTPVILAYSLRGPDDLMYGRELNELRAVGVDIRLIYTRTVPDAHRRVAGRLGLDDIAIPATGQRAERVYVCGPAGFVDHATALLCAAGYPDAAIRTERFGPSGAD
nr:FAD-binding oxidoreductase [Cumulibacter soli]